MGRFDPLATRPYYRDPVIITAAYLAVAAALVTAFRGSTGADVGLAAAVGVGVFFLATFVGVLIRKAVRRRAATRETRRQRRP